MLIPGREKSLHRVRRHDLFMSDKYTGTAGAADVPGEGREARQQEGPGRDFYLVGHWSLEEQFLFKRIPIQGKQMKLHFSDCRVCAGGDIHL